MNLLFDLDGTLFDPLRAIGNSLTYTFRRNHLPEPSLEKLRACIGPPLQESLVQILGATPEMAITLLKQYREHHAENMIADYAIYPGTRDILAQAHARHRVFLCTSKPHPYAAQIIRHYDLERFFVGIYGSELDGTRGTKPDLIHYLLAEEKLDRADTWMIGDRKHDILGAKANQLHSVGVLWGYGSREEFAAAGADQVVATWDEFRNLIN